LFLTQEILPKPHHFKDAEYADNHHARPIVQRGFIVYGDKV